jgi:hypothetical protein
LYSLLPFQLNEKISEELKKNLLVLMMSCHLLSSFQGTMFLRDYSLKTKQKQNTSTYFRISYEIFRNILRKEVIQPHLPIRLPCYDFTPIICPTLGGWLLAVTPPTLGVTNFRGVTGGVYKTRERIHRGMLIHDY